MARNATGARSSGWRSRDILRAAALLAGLYLLLQLLWIGRSIFLIGFLGVLFGLTLTTGVDWLQRFRVPRFVGALGLVLLVLGVITGLGWLTAPQISDQLREVKRKVPEAIGQVERWVQDRAGGVQEILESDTTAAPKPQKGAEDEEPKVDIRRGLSEQLAKLGEHFFSFFSSTLSVLAGLLLVLFVAIFVAVDPDLYHSGLMHLFPHRARTRAGEVLTATATTLRRWLTHQLLAMLLIGAVTTVVLMLMDVQGAIALGIIAGLLEFIPYIGPILSAVPAVAMGLLDSPEKALWVVVAYTAIQQLEGALVVPLLMKQGLELPPVITILGQALLGLVFGFLGLLVAVPLLGAIMVPIKMLYVQDVVGDEVTLPGEPEPA